MKTKDEIITEQGELILAQVNIISGLQDQLHDLKQALRDYRRKAAEDIAALYERLGTITAKLAVLEDRMAGW